MGCAAVYRVAPPPQASADESQVGVASSPVRGIFASPPAAPMRRSPSSGGDRVAAVARADSRPSAVPEGLAQQRCVSETISEDMEIAKALALRAHDLFNGCAQQRRGAPHCVPSVTARGASSVRSQRGCVRRRSGGVPPSTGRRVEPGVLADSKQCGGVIALVRDIRPRGHYYDWRNHARDCNRRHEPQRESVTLVARASTQPRAGRSAGGLRLPV